MEYKFLERGGRTVDFDYLLKLSSKGRINIVQAKTLTMIYDLLKQRVTIPWDLQLRWGKVYTKHINEYGICASSKAEHLIPTGLSIEGVNVVLLYEEIEIKNSRGVKHTIRDLYVTIPLNISRVANQVYFSTPMGRRGRTTLTEFKRGYRHSHLGSRAMNGSDLYTDNSAFCLGTGEINNTLSLINGELDPELFELLLHQLDVYVRWESLEGIPFIQINGLIGADYNIPAFDDVAARSILESIMYSKWAKFDLLRWKYDNKLGRYVITDTECIEKFLMDLRDKGSIRWEHFFYKDPAGNLFMEDTFTESTLEYNINKQEYFYFQNRKVTLIVDGKPLKATGDRQLYPHQKLVAHAKQFLEQRANASQIRESRIKEFR